MCGLIFSNNVELDISKCNTYLKKRGPDACGHFKNTFYEAYHTRLKIYDLSDKSNQPFSKDGINFLLFNGSIYNFKDLIDKYNLDYTNSDTAAIYDLLMLYGNNVIKEFNGMFSIVFFNINNNSISFIRDRYGIKPLFFFYDGHRFVISSSAKLIAKTLNLDINDDYIKFGIKNGFYDEFNSTPYQGVVPVKPGTISFFNNKKIITEYYYNIKNVPKNTYDIDKISHLIEESVKIRLFADREIGVSQSGGIDSSIISYVASTISLKKISALCFGKDDNKSEVKNAKKHSDNCNLNFISVDFESENKSFITLINDVLDAQEAPFLGTSIIAQYLVFKKAKELDLPVMLGGQGADELFCGYKKYLFFNKISFLSFINIFIEIFLNGYGFKKILKKFVKNKESNKFSYDFSSIKNLSYQDITYSSLPTLLRYEDRNSMAFSIETRLPFLDFNLVDYVNSLDKKYFLKHGFTKYPLRKIFNKKIDRKIIWNFFKRGFDTSDYFENDTNLSIVNKYIISNNNHLPIDLQVKFSCSKICKDWPVIISCLWYINERKQ